MINCIYSYLYPVLDEWKELPLVSPAQIRASRQIKHYFTGDLNAKVTTYPPFNGLEKHYVRKGFDS